MREQDQSPPLALKRHHRMLQQRRFHQNKLPWPVFESERRSIRSDDQIAANKVAKVGHSYPTFLIVRVVFVREDTDLKRDGQAEKGRSWGLADGLKGGIFAAEGFKVVLVPARPVGMIRDEKARNTMIIGNISPFTGFRFEQSE
jgi:hypothetical protein